MVKGLRDCLPGTWPGPGLLFSILALLLSTTAAKSQVSPPSNDDYTNRIGLTGTDITFTGTLAGATFELWQNEPLGQLGVASQSVWWEWTPTETVAVTIQVLSTSNKPTINRTDAVQVYTLDYSETNNTFYGRSLLGGSVIDTNTPKWFFSITAAAGTNYEIQLAGYDSASFTMRLLATNPPLILEPPKSQSITVGDSVLFTVLAAGAQKPFSYQWQFNGTNLPGETAPMLALENVSTNQAGAYQVWITNTNGDTTLSPPANLVVTATDSAPLLITQGTGISNQFAFGVLGEVGRRYRILSSTNLTDWSPERSFASSFYDYTAQSYFRSVIFNSSGSDTLGLPITTQQKFFRATPFHAVNEICNNRLKEIRFAQELYCYDNGYSFWSAAEIVNLLPYLKDNQFPNCPTTGIRYQVNECDGNPICLSGLHPFEEP